MARSTTTFVKGLLRWLVTIRSTSGASSAPTRRTIAPQLAAGRALDRISLRIAAAITDTVDPPSSVTHQVVVIAYGLNAARAGRQLLRTGYARAAESQIRSLLESYVVVESIHGDDTFAEAWAQAATRADRGAFEYAKLKKRSKAARDFLPLWDSLNEYVHTNTAAKATLTRSRAAFGFDLVVGPSFEPFPTAALLATLNGLHYVFIEWLCQNLVPASRRPRLQTALEKVGSRVSRSTREASRAGRALGEPAGKDGQSITEQRRALAFIAHTARRRGRRDIAIELLRRPRVRRRRQDARPS